MSVNKGIHKLVCSCALKHLIAPAVLLVEFTGMTSA